MYLHTMEGPGEVKKGLRLKVQGWIVGNPVVEKVPCVGQTIPPEKARAERGLLRKAVKELEACISYTNLIFVQGLGNTCKQGGVDDRQSQGIPEEEVSRALHSVGERGRDLVAHSPSSATTYRPTARVGQGQGVQLKPILAATRSAIFS